MEVIYHVCKNHELQKSQGNTDSRKETLYPVNWSLECEGEVVPYTADIWIVTQRADDPNNSQN